MLDAPDDVPEPENPKSPEAWKGEVEDVYKRQQRAQWKAQIIRQRMMRINEMPVMKEEGALIGTGASRCV